MRLIVRCFFVVALVTTGVLVYSQDCLPLAEKDIARLQNYVAAHYRVPGGVVVMTEYIERFPPASCMLRVPVRGKDPTARFNTTILLSSDHRYLANDLMDLTQEPVETDREMRREMRREMTEGESPVMLGRDKPVRVVVFSDFQCRYCRDLDRMLKSEVIPRVADVVSIRFRNLPLPSHRWAKDAAEVGACVSEEGHSYFWAFNDAVFSHQDEIFSLSDPIKELERVARGIPGVIPRVFDECRLQKRGLTLIGQDEKICNANAIVATPTIFVNEIRIEGEVVPWAETNS